MRRLAASVANHAHDREGADRGEGIRDEVEDRGGQTRAGGRHHADEDEARLSDGRVRKHPLDVGLAYRDDAADKHGEDRDDPQHRRPVPTHATERHVKDAKQCAECRDLDGGSHESRHGGRRTLIDVWGPLVERHGCHLEQQTDQQQAKTESQQRSLSGLGSQCIADANKLNGTAVAVDERGAVQEEGR